MSVRSCRVTIQDLGGTSHTAEVTASSLFEAVAQGLAALRKNEWVEGIEERFGMVKVSVAEVRVDHQVRVADLMKWLERPGCASPGSSKAAVMYLQEKKTLPLRWRTLRFRVPGRTCLGALPDDPLARPAGQSL